VNQTAVQSGFWSINSYRLLLGVFTVQLWIVLPAAALEISCHIHPPAQVKGSESPGTTFGPFATQSECENVRQQLFGIDGRCHCAPSFSSSLIRRRDRGNDSGHEDSSVAPLP
jgi:hypothetical protein